MHEVIIIRGVYPPYDLGARSSPAAAPSFSLPSLSPLPCPFPLHFLYRYDTSVQTFNPFPSPPFPFPTPVSKGPGVSLREIFFEI